MIGPNPDETPEQTVARITGGIMVAALVKHGPALEAACAVDDSAMWSPPGTEERRALSAPTSLSRLTDDDLARIANQVANRVVHLIDLRRLAREIAADLVEPVAARVATLLGMVAP